MSYSIRLKPSVEKQLNKLNKLDYARISRAISSLKDEPRQVGVIKLSTGNFLRIRVGDYRILYEIDEKKKLVMVARIARRSEDTYKGI